MIYLLTGFTARIFHQYCTTNNSVCWAWGWEDGVGVGLACMGLGDASAKWKPTAFQPADL